jgi:diguanylate cyclase (GGDEF)-like protein
MERDTNQRAIHISCWSYLRGTWRRRPPTAGRHGSGPRGRSALVFAAVGGIVASAVLSIVIHNFERFRAEAEFQQNAGQRLQAVRTNLTEAIDLIQVLASHFDVTGDGETGRLAFATLTSHALAEHSYLAALSWVPRVEGSARSKFERLAQADGFQDFSFVEFRPDGSRVAARERKEYFPVFYAEPLRGPERSFQRDGATRNQDVFSQPLQEDERALGYDLGSDPVLLAALLKAAETRQIVASARIRLVTENSDRYGIFLFAPVFDLTAAPDEFGKRKLRGFVEAVVRSSDIIRFADAGSATQEPLRLPLSRCAKACHSGQQASRDPLLLSETHLFDMTAPASERQLYPSAPEVEPEALLASGLHSQADFEIGGRKWLLVATPGAGYRTTAFSPASLSVLFAGFAITGIYLAFLRERVERFEQVAKSAAELAAAQDRLIAAKAEAEATALQDPLTGLPNRRLFYSRLALSLQRTERHPEFLCALLYLDLDHFKIINDSLGHQAGDELLVEVANRLQSSLRRTDDVSHLLGGEDLVSRLGGDEFGVLLDDIKDVTDALRVADRISERFTSPFELRGNSLSVTTSIGIATSASGYSTAESMLRDADTAMYRAKATGRGKRVVFDEAMHAHAVERLQLESGLRQAIKRQEFVLLYQPIVSLRDQQIVSFEALLRWRSPQRGLVGPATFLSVAEETGLIVPIGAWVLRESCAQLRRWQERFGREPLLTVSVNLSAKQFLQPDLVSTVAGILDETGLEGSSLCLELTESVAMEQPERTCLTLEEMRRLGVRLSVDDFGTGYSSLDQLHRFCVDTLKVDRSFVARMEEDERNQNIVKTIINLAHNMRLNVIAEGAESAAQVELLNRMECDCAQGYFFARAADPQQFDSLLEQRCARSTINLLAESSGS